MTTPLQSAPAAATSSASHPTYRVEVVSSIDRLTSILPAWDSLANAALVANPFYEAWMLLPALRTYADPATFQAMLVFREGAGRPPQLTGLFPCERFARFRGLPCRGLALWKQFAVMATPLLHRDHAREVLRAFIDWAAVDRRGARLIDFGIVDAERSFGQVLTDVVNERLLVTSVEDQFNRAFLRPRGSTDEYLAAAFGNRHRQELRRQRRRLTDLGTLETRVLASGESLDRWLDQFIALEAAGWKGSEQTAIANRPEEVAFYRTIAGAAHANDRLYLLGLFLDGRPIAMKMNFLCGGGAFALKTAYDEQFAKFSPGVLLELDVIDDAHKSGRFGWVDSCAKSNHAMIERLWIDRRAMQRRVVSTGGTWGNVVLGLTALARAVKRSLPSGARP
jgi:CelD/BcsL family acetyltransferase involved in cellulose biosynthesis